MEGIEEKVRGIGFGEEDYMKKKLNKEEMIESINEIVRR